MAQDYIAIDFGSHLDGMVVYDFVETEMEIGSLLDEIEIEKMAYLLDSLCEIEAEQRLAERRIGMFTKQVGEVVTINRRNINKMLDELLTPIPVSGIERVLETTIEDTFDSFESMLQEAFWELSGCSCNVTEPWKKDFFGPLSQHIGLVRTYWTIHGMKFCWENLVGLNNRKPEFPVQSISIGMSCSKLVQRMSIIEEIHGQHDVFDLRKSRYSVSGQENFRDRLPIFLELKSKRGKAGMLILISRCVPCKLNSVEKKIWKSISGTKKKLSVYPAVKDDIEICKERIGEVAA